MTFPSLIRCGAVSLVVAIALCGGLPESGFPIPLAAQEVEPVDAASAPADALDPMNGERQEQRRRAYAGLLALLGIVVAGAAVVGLIILWAGRLRRANRAPLPGAELKDELWFLRPPRNESDISRSPADDDTVT